MSTPHFVTLGMFIIDEIVHLSDDGHALDDHPLAAQIGGGGTYAALGARIWLPADQVGMIIDRGNDFPQSMHDKLLLFGSEMWYFRDHANRPTTRALNSYRGDHRGFKYLTSKIRITPNDLTGTRLAKPRILHFICSPTRALGILKEVEETDGWSPTIIYEPIPVRMDSCIPEELPALIKVLPSILVLSPNAEEAMSLLSLPPPVTKASVEQAAGIFQKAGVGPAGTGCVVIRSGETGAYLLTSQGEGMWVDPFWRDSQTVVDVTGAGNSFLGGLAAGLILTNGNIHEAMLYATVSASFVIEQVGLPSIDSEEDSAVEKWNGDLPRRRFEELKLRRRREG